MIVAKIEGLLKALLELIGILAPEHQVAAADQLAAAAAAAKIKAANAVVTAATDVAEAAAVDPVPVVENVVPTTQS